MAKPFIWDNTADAHLKQLVGNMFENKLGPMMEAEVKSNAPVGTGNLRESVSFHVDWAKCSLIVSATGSIMRKGSNRKYYAAWVDLGHRVFAWGHETGEVKMPTAFMRRALYKRYPGF